MTDAERSRKNKEYKRRRKAGIWVGRGGSHPATPAARRWNDAANGRMVNGRYAEKEKT